MSDRFERFCRTFADHGNAAAAAREAGYTPRSARRIGHRLLRDPRIAARIAALHEETALAHGSAREVLIGKLEIVFRHALEHHKFSAAIQAVAAQSRLATVRPAVAPIAWQGVPAAGNDNHPLGTAE